MRHYKAGDAASWKKYENETIQFSADHKHTIHMKVISTDAFAVYANGTLIGTGNNEVIQVSTTIYQATDITITSKKDAYVWLPEAQGETVRVFPDENFVSLEPRKSINPEIYAMKLKMEENMNRMNRMLMEERARRAPPPAPAPEPEETVIEDDKPSE